MSAGDANDQAEPSHDDHTPAGPAGQAAIDVERLADKVYQLMLAEARLARTRHEHQAE
jgi:hypothetical protein